MVGCGLHVCAQRSDFDSVDFGKADSLAFAHSSMTLDNAPLLVRSLTETLETDVERFRAIYIWVCTNISNDYAMFTKNMRKRRRFRNDSLKLHEWNEEFKIDVFKQLIKRKRTICTGYAYLVKELADMANLNCEMVHGFGRIGSIELEDLQTPNHSWNVIELNGKWYFCDPTWASGAVDGDTHHFFFSYNDAYFLTDPKLFAMTHFPLDSKWFLLEDSAPQFSEFVKRPVIYREAYGIISGFEAPKQMHSDIAKDDHVTFTYQLVSEVKQDDISLLIDNGENSRKAQSLDISTQGNKLNIEYQFKQIGFFDVHLMIKDEYIATYTFKVNRG